MAYPDDEVDSCAFLPCDQVTKCCLPGGCVQKRFGRQRHGVAQEDPLKKGQRALVGTKPGRAQQKQAELLTTTRKKK